MSGPGGGGSAAATNNQHTMFASWEGPASYPTGGFEIDLTATYSVLRSLSLQVETLGSLPVVEYQIDLNSPADGKATVKLVRQRFTRVSSVGNAQNAPTGITIQAASGVASSNESAHTHSINHAHGVVTSGVPVVGGGQVALNALGPALSNHTHNLDFLEITATSGAGTAHNHTDNSIYQHQHSITQSATDITRSEVPNATNLSTTTWALLATGVKI